MTNLVGADVRLQSDVAIRCCARFTSSGDDEMIDRIDTNYIRALEYGNFHINLDHFLELYSLMRAV